MEYSSDITPFEKLDKNLLKQIISTLEGVTPAYVYFSDYIKHQINTLKILFQPARSPVDVTIRYAMKALSNANILRLIDQ